MTDQERLEMTESVRAAKKETHERLLRGGLRCDELADLTAALLHIAQTDVLLEEADERRRR